MGVVRFVFWLGLVFLSTGVVESSTQRSLHLEAYPRISYEPATIRFRILVEPHQDQVSIRVETDNGVFGRLTEIPLDGANGPRANYLEWRDLPAGDYVIWARLATTARVVASAQTPIVVLR